MDYAALTDVLTQQEEALQALLQLLEREGDALAANRPQELGQLLQRKADLQERVTGLEKARLSFCPQEQTLSHIVAQSPAAYQPELTRLQRSMLSLAEHMQEANEKNCLLIKQSLDYAQFMLNVFGSVKNCLYGPDGQLAGSIRLRTVNETA
ncbi:MAG: flagellar protein FlgN [Clostridiales bacterium]|jgi:flagellar biosynthesis/type III secretory pathway chaperone|nr:flagellar protein FlgN [Clostridiales bacterium]